MSKEDAITMLELKIGEAKDGMDALEFIAAMTGSLAWPIAAVVIAWFFRAQISGLLAKIRKLSWGDKVADFADKLDKIEAAEPVALTTEDHLEAVATSNDWRSDPLFQSRQFLPDERFQKLLAISPAAAILDAWKGIETRLFAIGQDREHQLQMPDGRIVPIRSVNALLKILSSEKAISSETLAMIRALQELRNEAVHRDEVTIVDAVRFNALAQQALFDLDHRIKAASTTDTKL